MRRALAWSVALAILTLPACGGDDPAEPGGNGGGGTTPAAIAVAAGNNQRIIVGGQLITALRVQVTDDQNQGVSGTTVDWDVTQGSGTLSGSTSTTNTNGEATIMFTAGASAETNTISASVDGVTGTATFTATAVTPSAIAVSAGDNQEVRTNIPLADALEARVTAGDGGPVPGATVDWEVTAGVASLATATSTADAGGDASASLTAGGIAGAVEVTASLPGGAASTTFDVQVSTPVTVTVTMQNTAFNAPGGGDDVTILLGDAVRWVNADAVSHTATSNQEPAGGSTFDSGLLNQNGEFEFVPDVRGVWEYFCEVHPVLMAGARITVE